MGPNTNGGIDLTLMEPVFDTYKEQKGALIPILQKAQGVYGYLPPEALELIADRLDVAVSKVYGVATFYSQFYLERRQLNGACIADGYTRPIELAS